MKEKTIQTSIQYDGQILSVRKDLVQLEDGQIAQRELVVHPGGVGIALEDEQGLFFMVEQFRYGTQCVTLEFPAGKRERDEDDLTTAIREAREETGYEALDPVYLGQIFPTPAYDSETIAFYHAKAGRFVGMHLDDDENLHCCRLSLDDILNQIDNGTICDAKTIAIAYHLYRKRVK